MIRCLLVLDPVFNESFLAGRGNHVGHIVIVENESAVGFDHSGDQLVVADRSLEPENGRIGSVPQVQFELFAHETASSDVVVDEQTLAAVLAVGLGYEDAHSSGTDRQQVIVSGEFLPDGPRRHVAVAIQILRQFQIFQHGRTVLGFVRDLPSTLTGYN